MLQTAQAIAQLARKNAADDAYQSPYTQVLCNNSPPGKTCFHGRPVLVCSGVCLRRAQILICCTCIMQEALRQGIDLSWWEKLKKSKFMPRDGGFKLGKLQVECIACQHRTDRQGCCTTTGCWHKLLEPQASLCNSRIYVKLLHAGSVSQELSPR